jgi:hypothetical protein
MDPKDNIKRKTIIKDGWLIQQEKTDNSIKLKASNQKVHKDKDGNIIGHTQTYREVSFSSRCDKPEMKQDSDNEYEIDEILGKQIMVHLQDFFNLSANKNNTRKNKNMINKKSKTQKYK